MEFFLSRPAIKCCCTFRNAAAFRARVPGMTPHAVPLRAIPRRPKDFAAAAASLRPSVAGRRGSPSHRRRSRWASFFRVAWIPAPSPCSRAAPIRESAASRLLFPAPISTKRRWPAPSPSRCGSNHTEVPFDGAAILSRLDESLGALDQPTMDGINTYFVSWAAREVGLKVALSGLGGDELFAGYSTFSDVPRLQQLGAAGKVFAGIIRGAFPHLCCELCFRGAGTNRRRAQSCRRLDRFHCCSASLLLRPRSFSSRWPSGKTNRSQFSRQHRGRRWRHPRTHLGRLAAAGLRRSPKVATHCRNFLARDAHLHGQHVVARHRLRKHGPFAGSARAASRYAARGIRQRAAGRRATARRRAKALLVESLRDLLPPEILAQRKRTFTLPWEEWLRGPLRPRLEASFASLAPALAEHLHSDGVLAVWNEFLAGKTSWSRPWSLFVSERMVPPPSLRVMLGRNVN